MRKTTIKHHVKRCFPIRHWRKCCRCNAYFKWEFGWYLCKRWGYPLQAQLFNDDIYLCRKCARTKEVADHILVNV